VSECAVVGVACEALTLSLSLSLATQQELLLKDIIKHTWPEHADYRHLCDALEGVMEVANHLNDSMAALESLMRVAHICFELRGCPVRCLACLLACSV